jgi:hypothetical protein
MRGLITLVTDGRNIGFFAIAPKKSSFLGKPIDGRVKHGHDAGENCGRSWTPASAGVTNSENTVLAANDRDMKKVLDSVTLLGHVFATLEKWASNPREK